VSVGDGNLVTRVRPVAVHASSLGSAEVSEVVVAEQKRCIEEIEIGVKKNGSENSKRTPTRYIPTLFFLNTLPGRKRHV
jgi:hypothetical protein